MKRAFTLIELLMVLLIIGIVIAIVIPALGGARNAARGASTRQLITSVVTSTQRFTNDREGQLPGFFSVREMGVAGNKLTGFTSMENAMLDLAGGVVNKDAATEPNEIEIEVHGISRKAVVDTDRFGTGDYFEFSKGEFSTGDVGQVGDVNPSGENVIPDLLDAWGNPMLMWTEDLTGPAVIDDPEKFAKEDSGGNGDESSHFYWATNAGFLNSTLLGKGGKNQVQESLLAEGAFEIPESLMGVLGNPSFPDNRSKAANEILATASRGRFMVHSAGADGVYFSRRDRGAKQIGADDMEGIEYGTNFKTAPGGTTTDLLNDKGQVETRDVIKGFDDVLVAGGN